MSKFKEMLKQHNVTQQKLADALGVHQTLISQWCQGKGKPNVYHISKIAKCVGATADEVVSAFTSEVIT